MTTRRDLDALEERGVCQRIHGGAIALRITQYRNIRYPSYWQRERCQVNEKVAIGHAAAALVQPGDIVAVDTGSTAAYMAQALRACDACTVLTNSIRVLDQLHDVTHIALICPGGTLSVEERNTSGGDLAFVGPIAVETLRSFRPKRAFISTSGIKVPDGISNASLFQAEIKRTMIETADEAILMTDHTKFGRIHGFLVSNLNPFDRIITDTLAPPHDIEALRDMGIQVTLVEPTEDGSILRPAVMSASISEAGSDDCNEPSPLARGEPT
jgi:DeoR/GlpR family transcriptional regulator of sugar metabolism